MIFAIRVCRIEEVSAAIFETCMHLNPGKYPIIREGYDSFSCIVTYFVVFQISSMSHPTIEKQITIPGQNYIIFVKLSRLVSILLEILGKKRKRSAKSG